MSIIYGKAERFKTRDPTMGSNPNAPLVDESALRKPPPPLAYQGLRSGPKHVAEYDPNITIPVDGAQQLLRSLSPFILRVEPPAVFANDPAFLDAKNGKGLGVYENAFRGSSGFENARGVIGNQYSFGSLGSGGNAGQPISKAQQPSSVSGNDPHKMVTVDGTPPDSLGRPAITDLYSALDIASQLQAILDTPPLVLLINPQTLSLTFTKIQQFSDKTRYGNVFQAWGEEQPRMAIAARCGAFYSGQRGVQLASKRDSASWQNLMNAFTFYQNNGYLHDTIGKSNAHHFVGALSIHYDGWVYYGHMESFQYAYEEQNQLGGVAFNMEFVVSTMVDTTQANSVVTPMKSPTQSLSNFKLERRTDLNQEGTLSIGLDGEVDDRLFGGNPPQNWGRGPEGTPHRGVPPNSAMPPKKGAGFRPPFFALETAPEMADFPQPFRISR